MSHAFVTSDEKTKFFYNPDLSGEVLIVSEDEDGNEYKFSLENQHLKEYLAHVMRHNMILQIEEMTDDEVLKL